ncbi:hypothetical protein TWF481_008710 [Arthrobotrys musiformis]|uniref:TF-B3 domain-containing protein n=1 Tax=Arthrobotrys musiformis TaxID=47236 RepID=A0AAV9W9H8_9PEZI
MTNAPTHESGLGGDPMPMLTTFVDPALRRSFNTPNPQIQHPVQAPDPNNESHNNVDDDSPQGSHQCSSHQGNSNQGNNHQGNNHQGSLDGACDSELDTEDSQEYNDSDDPDDHVPTGLVYGRRIKLTQYAQIPNLEYPTKISIHGAQDGRCWFDRIIRPTISATKEARISICLDPTFAVIERLLQQFREGYVKTAVGVPSEQQCRKMFLLKYKNYKFTRIRSDGFNVWGKWVVKGRFRKEKAGGYVVWKKGQDLDLVEFDDTSSGAPRLVRRLGKLLKYRS